MAVNIYGMREESLDDVVKSEAVSSTICGGYRTYYTTPDMLRAGLLVARENVIIKEERTSSQNIYVVSFNNEEIKHYLIGRQDCSESIEEDDIKFMEKNGFMSEIVFMYSVYKSDFISEYILRDESVLVDSNKNSSVSEIATEVNELKEVVSSLKNQM